MDENVVQRAFRLATEKLDSMAIVCGILNVSNAYAYNAMKTGELSLPCSLKMEILIDGEISWRELCPKVDQELKAVEARLARY